LSLTIVAVRHGRTAWNLERRFQGHTDIPLDATGLAQARALAAHLRGERFDAAYSSDLSRARETAQCIVADRAHLQLTLDPRWREMKFGVWEGSTWPEISARFPEVAAAPNAGGDFLTPPEGEAFADLCARVAAALADLRAASAPGATVLLATHAGPLHALLRVVLGASEADALKVRFEPASLTRLRLADAGGELLELNVVPEPVEVA